MAKNGSKWAAGALVAGVAGYVAGILTAPKSGKETRQEIKEVASKTTREAEKQLKSVYQDLTDMVDQGKERAGKVSAKGKQELDEMLAKASKGRDKAKELLTAVHEGDVEDPELQKALADLHSLKDHLKKYFTKA